MFKKEEIEKGLEFTIFEGFEFFECKVIGFSIINDEKFIYYTGDKSGEVEFNKFVNMSERGQITKIYSMDELIKSTQNRMGYNAYCANEAAKRGDISEMIRFANNIIMMQKDIESTKEYNDKDYLIENRDN